jgi:F-type H+-transporting ATPase subunit epsilon
MHLDIVTPDRRLVSETVDEVVLPGSEGYLGVLPGHAPLLTSLGIGYVMHRREGTRRYLALAGGFAEVLPDRVTILADISERADAIDRDRAERARDRALKRLRDKEPGTDFDRAQIALMKALIRLQISQGAGPNEPS